MSISPEFTAHVAELLQTLGSISTRRMFGGVGIYCDALMMALIVEDTLYFKTDEHNRAEFEAAGLPAFAYLAKGEWVRTSYYRAPEEALDSPALMLPWAKLGLAAALRARAKKKTKTQKR